MRIAYLGSFSHPWKTEWYVAYALEQLGHEVIRIREEGTPALPRCDLFLYAKGRVANFAELLHQAKAGGAITVCWLYDLYWGTKYEYLVQSDVFEADFVFTTDGGHQHEWRSVSVNHFLLRQGIHEPEAFMRTGTADGIIFVGSNLWGTHRANLLSFLEETYGSRFRRYGEYDTGEIRGTALNDLFAKTKVVIGHSIGSPRYWSNRIYETLGRGGFLIHPAVEGLDEEFTPHRHYVPYRSLGELKEAIDYYLEREDEREAIRRAGHQYCAQHYTYRHRCLTLLQTVRGGRQAGSI